MSSAMNNQKPKKAIDVPVVVLSSEKDDHTGRNNYIEWVASTWADLTQVYGLVASVLETQVAYEGDMPPDEQDQPNHTTTQIQALRL
jgi:hypothetical protein